MAVIGDQIIISGDAHFAEPADLFQTRLPRRLRDKAPHTINELPPFRRTGWLR